MTGPPNTSIALTTVKAPYTSSNPVVIPKRMTFAATTIRSLIYTSEAVVVGAPSNRVCRSAGPCIPQRVRQMERIVELDTSTSVQQRLPDCASGPALVGPTQPQPLLKQK